MRASIKLGMVRGIEIGLHYSWVLIAILITLSLGSQFRVTNPEWTTSILWLSAAFTAALFFVGIVLHELSHALVALAHGLSVRSIVLFALGGIADMRDEAPDARTEFKIAVAGPIMSLAIGGVCLSLGWALGWSATGGGAHPVAAITGWLGYINVALAVFNLLPGFPLDGGRMLKAVLWGATGDKHKALRWAASVGQGLAMLFIVLGLLQFFGGGAAGGLWLAFIGWFLIQAAQASVTDAEVKAHLGDVRVADLMSGDGGTVDPALDLQTFVDERLLRTGQRCFIVGDNGTPMGLITVHEVKQRDREQWRSTRVADVMRPIDKVSTVGPDATAADALSLMTTRDVNQVPVVSQGRVAGLVSRSRVLQFVQDRLELERGG